MAISAGSVFVDLGARLDKREFELYDLELKKVREKVARREQFKAQLGANYDARAFNAYERQLKTSQRATDEHVKATGKLRTAFGTVWGRGGAAFAAVGGAYGLVTAVKSVTGAYQESQISQKQMQTQLKALGISYQEHAKHIDDVIQKTSRLAGLDDEDLQNAFTNIVRATGKVNESLKLTALAADIARARHMDVVKAGQLLGKVAEGNVTALTRYGIVLTKSTKNVDDLKASNDHATKSQLEAAAAADKQANAQSAVAELQRRFGGQAAAYGRTQAGAIDRLKVAWENLRETLGKNLAPALTRAADKLATFLDQMNRGVGTGGDFVRTLRGMIAVFRALGRFVATTTDIILGFFTGILKASKAVFDLASHLPGVGDKFKGLSNRAQNAMDSINNFRESLRPARAKIVDLGDTVQKMSETMSTASRNGGLALTRNISKATHLVSQRVQNAAGDVDSGMSRIQKSLERELGQLGVSGGIKAKPLGKNFVPGLGKAAGGWIGAPGMVGHDTELALLAPGEAVLNRHQQAIVEGLLGDGFLDRLFSSVQKPHYLAKGGRVAKRYALGGSVGSSFGKGQLESLWEGAGGSPALANVMAAIALAESGGNRFAHNPSGASGLWQILGQIVPGNIYDPQVNAANAVAKYRTQGLGAWAVYTSGAYKRFLGAGAGVPAGAAGGGGIGPLVQLLPGLQVGGSGALQQIVQAALNAGTTGANQYLDANAPTGGGGASSTTGLVPQVQRALAWARGHGWHGNVISGFRTRAEQAVLYARYLAGGNLAARPGTSNHERGRAVDVSDIPGFRNAMSSAPPGSRLLWFGPGDSAHFSVDGHARGGRIRRYAKGKRGLVASHAHSHAVNLPAQDNRGVKRSIARKEHGIAGFEDQIQRLERQYDQKDRLFGLSDETFIIEHDDGSATVDQKAVHQRTAELNNLIKLRKQIEHTIVQYRKKVQQLVKTYRNAVKFLTAAMNAAKGKARRKQRAGYRQSISDYRSRIRDLVGVGKDLGLDIEDQVIDLQELRDERKSVLGSAGHAADAGAGATDTGGGDTGPTPDQQAIIDQLTARLAAATQSASFNASALQAFSSSGDIGTGGSSALRAVTAPFTSVSGTAGTPSGSTPPTRPLAPTIIVNTLHPADPATLRAIGNASVSGISLQPSRSSSVQTLGI